MNKQRCMQCLEPFEGRIDALYCSAKCRVTAKRNREKIVVTDNAKCNMTFKDLSKRVQTEINGMTNWCKMKGIEDDREARIKRAIHYQQLFSDSRSKSRRFTGQMTDFEKANYKPVSELKPGQYNPVSKPGDFSYGPDGNNKCKQCGKDTGHKLVVKCLTCCSAA